jgi:hypothetical protein
MPACSDCACILGIPGDFHLETELKLLENNAYEVVQCDHCGIAAIGKSSYGDLYIAFQDVESKELMPVLKWKPYKPKSTKND